MSSGELKLSITSRWINPVYMPYLRNDKSIQIFFGGSSSGKSHFLAQRCILDVMQGRNYLICRKTGDSIKRSVFNEIYSKILDYPTFRQNFKINKADLTITCKLNNKQIMFRGLDDVEKVKSVKPISGVLTDIWIEEATEISRDDWKQLDKRLRGKSEFNKRVIFSFNPIIRSHWIYKEFFQGLWLDNQGNVFENDSCLIVKTTYKDNCFLTQDDITRLERETDPYYRSVYLEGNWGVLEGVVFNNWRVEEFDKEHFQYYRFGVDWGFSDDPFAFIRCAIDIPRGKLWVCDEVFKKGMLNNEAIPIVRDFSKGLPVYCDSAEPKSIHEFNANGVNAFPVKKGAGSIQEGIKFLKRFDIIVHPSCPHIQEEFSSYCYKKDPKTGEFVDDVVDKYNHGIDALRYSIECDMLMSYSFADVL